MSDKTIYLLIDTCPQAPEIKAMYYTSFARACGDLKDFNEDCEPGEERFLGPFKYKLVKTK